MRLSQFVEAEYWPTIQAGLSPKWQKHTRYLLDILIQDLGEYELDQLPPRVVDAFWIRLKLKYRTPVTPNKVIVRAKHLFKTAIRWKHLTENPFSGIKLEKEKVPPFQPLTDAQHDMLIEQACPSLQWYLVFARYTGGRRSSIAKLEERDCKVWMDGTEKRATLTFRDTKNGEDYTIPAHPKLIPWIERGLTGNPTRPLLPQYRELHTITSLFRRLRKRHGIKQPFRYHDYRHNVGSRLAEAGHDVKVRMQLLGHKDVRSSIRYTHASMETMEKAMKDVMQ